MTNYHTHTTYCDGKNTPEEIVVYAIENGFKSLGFSGHGYTAFDLRYCMKDTNAYITEISRLKHKYKNKIQIYCGVEEDAFSPVNRSDFDYIIGSSHYFNVSDNYYPIDSNYDYFKKCLEIFDYDVIRLSETYYTNFIGYIKNRKPDIIGHFDVITKFEEIDEQRFFCNEKYLRLSEKYIQEAALNNVLFELNTGAVSRNLRTQPYPAQNLLYVLKKCESGIILSSDSHCTDTLQSYFDDARTLLRDIGFKYVYEIDNGEFVKIKL